MSKPLHAEVKVIRLLYKIGHVLGVIPPFNLKNGRITKPKFYDFYIVLIAFTIIVGYVITAIGRTRFPNPNFSITVSYLALSTIFTLGNICAVIVPSLIHPKRLESFLKFFFKSSFSTRRKLDKKIYLFALEIFIGHSLLLAMFSLDCYTWTMLVGFDHYKYHILRLGQTYYLFITVMIVSNFLLSIRENFKSANEHLESGKTLFRHSLTISIGGHEKDFHLQESVKQAAHLYEQLTEQVDLFNSLFGWQIFFLVGTIMVGFVRTFNVMLTYNKDRAKIELTMLTVCWSSVYMILGTIVAVSCESTAKEARRTAGICYKLLLNLPAASEEQHEIATWEQLNVLAQMSTQRCPSFSAAGFFQVNYSMLLALFGSVTSYVILVVQLAK